MNTTRSVTLEDVARAAHVSTATVSRALSLPHKVSPATLSRVQAAVDRLGYVAHGAARALASRRTLTRRGVRFTTGSPSLSRYVCAVRTLTESVAAIPFHPVITMDPSFRESAAPRAGAHYHNLGKGTDPASFIENTRGENRLADLPPQTGAERVRRHVEDGVAIARRWKLPRAVVDIVAQHHGTRLVSFFGSKERRPGDAEGELDPAFRYGGPRPQTREAGVFMIADACEASSRELPETSPERLLHLVRRRISEIVDVGQLDESELTIGDLDAIARAMAAALDAVYRARSDGASHPPASPDRAASLQLVRP